MFDEGDAKASGMVVSDKIGSMADLRMRRLEQLKRQIHPKPQYHKVFFQNIGETIVLIYSDSYRPFWIMH